MIHGTLHNKLHCWQQIEVVRVGQGHQITSRVVTNINTSRPSFSLQCNDKVDHIKTRRKCRSVGILRFLAFVLWIIFQKIEIFINSSSSFFEFKILLKNISAGFVSKYCHGWLHQMPEFQHSTGRNSMQDQPLSKNAAKPWRPILYCVVVIQEMHWKSTGISILSPYQQKIISSLLVFGSLSYFI